MNRTLSIPFYMFILYLLLSVFIGSIQEAIISISFDRPSVCGCWLAETCIWYFAVWLVMRVFSRAVVTLPLISAFINQRFAEAFVSTSALVVLFTFDVSVTSIWKSTSTRSISREGIGTNPINGALTRLCHCCHFSILLYRSFNIEFQYTSCYYRSYHQKQFAGRNSMLSLPIPVVLRLLQ